MGRAAALPILIIALLASSAGWAQDKLSDATDMQAVRAAVRADKRGWSRRC